MKSVCIVPHHDIKHVVGELALSYNRCLFLLSFLCNFPFINSIICIITLLFSSVKCKIVFFRLIVSKARQPCLNKLTVDGFLLTVFNILNRKISHSKTLVCIFLKWGSVRKMRIYNVKEISI